MHTGRYLSLLGIISLQVKLIFKEVKRVKINVAIGLLKCPFLSQHFVGCA